MSVSKIKRSDLEFGDELGRGGFSTVYKAKWRTRNQDVAAKKLLNKSKVSEVQIMSKLDHENIVKLLAVVDEHPDFFLILELCNGGSLRAYLDNLKQNGRRLPDDQFYDWAKQTARPIEYLKTMGIIHKDVKSENYVIADEKNLKLTDFGLAKEIDATIENATGSATYTHMAPELLKEFILSPTYDIFSYGGVIWELWTTETPFKGLERYAIIWKVCEKNEHPPIPADCPRAISDLMRQCWLVKWEDRPSISQVLSVIEDSAAAAATKVARQRQPINGPWKLEGNIGVEDEPGRQTFPPGIAVNSDGDIAASSHQVYSAQGANILRLLVVGMTATGKSSLGNHILGAVNQIPTPFVSGSSPGPVTTDLVKNVAYVFGYRVSIVDTPGLFSAANYHDHDVLMNGISLLQPGPHAILLTVRIGRFTEEFIQCLERMREFFGENISRFLIIIFTHVDRLVDDDCEDNEGRLQQFVNGIPEDNPCYKLLKSCDMRYVGINNKLKLTSKENHRQIKALLSMVYKLSRNGKTCLTRKLLDKNINAKNKVPVRYLCHLQ